MQAKLLLFILFLILSKFLSAQKFWLEETDVFDPGENWKNLELKGPVKQILETKRTEPEPDDENENNNSKKESIHFTHYYFDSLGRLIKVKEAQENDSLKVTRFYQYVGERLVATQNPIYDKTFVYDASGKLIKEKRNKGSKVRVFDTLTLEFQYKNDLLVASIEREKDEISYGSYFSYDKSNRLVKKTMKIGNTTYLTHRYEYDSESRLIKESWKENEPDSRGKCLYLYPNDSVQMLVYDNQESSRIEHHEATRINGLLTESNSWFGDPQNKERAVYTYELDAYGNWTKEQYWRDGILISTIDRVFTYYL